MQNLAKPNLEEALLNHELEFITDSPKEVFSEYLVENGEQPDLLIKQFDAAAAQAADHFASIPGNDVLEKKRYILEDLLKYAATLGMTIDVTIDDIPELIEEELDSYILMFSSPKDDDEAFED